MTHFTMGWRGVCPAPWLLRKGVSGPSHPDPPAWTAHDNPLGNFKKWPAAVPWPHPDQTGKALWDLHSQASSTGVC